MECVHVTVALQRSYMWMRWRQRLYNLSESLNCASSLSLPFVRIYIFNTWQVELAAARACNRILPRASSFDNLLHPREFAWYERIDARENGTDFFVSIFFWREDSRGFKVRAGNLDFSFGQTDRCWILKFYINMLYFTVLCFIWKK